MSAPATSSTLAKLPYAVFLSHTGRHGTDLDGSDDAVDDEKQPLSQSPKVVFAYPLAVMLCVLGDFEPREIFLDFLSLRGPLGFHEFIPAALRGTRVFVAVLSSHFTQSKWCRRETVEFDKLRRQQPQGTTTRSMLPLFWQVKPPDVQGGPVFDTVMSPEEQAAFQALCDANGVLPHFGESARDYLVGNIKSLLGDLHRRLSPGNRRVFSDQAVALTSSTRSHEWRRVAGLVYDAAVEQIRGIGGNLVPEAEFRDLVHRLRDRVRGIVESRAGGARHHALAVKEYGLPQPMPNFVGRKELVDRLERLLTSQRAGVPSLKHARGDLDDENKHDDEVPRNTIDRRAGTMVLTAVAGMGGVGKTSVANHLVHRLKSSVQSLCAWFPAENPEVIVGHYRTVGQLMGWAGEKDSDELVKSKFQAWCASHSGWLLVYDNAEDVEAVRALLPTARNGRVLVTSRQRDWGDHVDADGVVNVAVMDEGDAVALLDRLSGQHHATASVEFVRELGYLPLAIAKMAAVIKNQRKPIDKALADFKKQELSKWLRKAKRSKDLRTIALVWQSSFAAMEKDIEEMDLLPYARAFMYYSAYLVADNIPRSALVQWAESLPDEDWSGEDVVDELLGTLQRYSLITLSDDSYSIHRLLQAVLRMEFEAMSAEDVAAVPGLSVPFSPAFVSRLVRTVRYDFWRETEDVPADEARQKAWRPHVQELRPVVDKHLGGVMDQAAFYVLASRAADRHAGYASRIELCREALSSYRRWLAARPDAGHGDDRDDGLDDEHKERNGAVRSGGQGRGLVAHYENHMDDYVDRVRAFEMLLWAYADAGRLKEAGALATEARQLLECGAVDVTSRVEAADLWHVMGGVADDRGHYDDAMEAYGKSLDVLSNQETPDTVHNRRRRADCLNSMALVHQSRGKYDEALRLYGEALAIFKAVHGENVPHPHVATTLNNMGNVHESRGKYDEAMRLYVEALAMFKAVYGENVPHPDVANTLLNTANVHYSRGEYDEALRLYGESLAMKKVVYGENVPHPSVASSLMGMAIVHKSQGEYDEALRLYGEALAMKTAVHGENVPHPSVANTLYDMGTVHMQIGQHQTSAVHFAQAACMYRVVYGPDHFWTTESITRSTKALAAAGRSPAEVDAARRALEAGQPLPDNYSQ